MKDIKIAIASSNTELSKCKKETESFQELSTNLMAKASAMATLLVRIIEVSGDLHNYFVASKAGAGSATGHLEIASAALSSLNLDDVNPNAATALESFASVERFQGVTNHNIDRIIRGTSEISSDRKMHAHDLDEALPGFAQAEAHFGEAVGFFEAAIRAGEEQIGKL